MINKRAVEKSVLLMFSLLALLIFSTSAIAVGLSPAKINLNFKPGLQVNKTLYAINSGHEKGTINPSITGTLKDYITAPEEIEIAKDHYKIPFEIQIRLPESLPPGPNLGYVKLKGMLQQRRDMIVATTGVKGKIEVNVPYPEKYLEAELFTRRTHQKTVDFTLGLRNVGVEDIEEIKAFIRLLQDQKEVYSIYTDSISLPSQAGDKITAMDQKVPTGNYIVDVSLEYDGKEVKLKDKLSVEEDKIIVKKEPEPIEDETDLTPFLIGLSIVLVLLLIIITIMHIKGTKK